MWVDGKKRLTNVRITSSNSSLWYLIHCATMTYLFGSTVNWRAHWNRSIGRSNWQNVKRRSNVRRAKGWCHAFQLDSILFTDWRSPLDGIEDAIVGLDAIAAQMERPIHGKEDIVVHHIGFVIFASFFGIQGDDVDDFSDAKTTTSIRPCNMSLEEEHYNKLNQWKCWVSMVVEQIYNIANFFTLDLQITLYSWNFGRMSANCERVGHKYPQVPGVKVTLSKLSMGSFFKTHSSLRKPWSINFW